MYREIKLSDCPGKTLKGVWISDETALVVFSDETFTTLRASAGYDYDCPEIEEAKVTLRNFSHRKLVESGIVIQAELDELLSKWNAEDRERKERWEREQYEVLRKKFEG